jgi:hypothetical protein
VKRESSDSLLKEPELISPVGLNSFFVEVMLCHSVEAVGPR